MNVRLVIAPIAAVVPPSRLHACPMSYYAHETDIYHNRTHAQLLPSFVQHRKYCKLCIFCWANKIVEFTKLGG